MGEDRNDNGLKENMTNRDCWEYVGTDAKMTVE
jgi:hypothetical protein